MNAAKSKKTVGRPFKKGQSGNPSGRPKIPDCFKNHNEEAQQRIIELMDSDDEATAFKAAALVVAYNLGKPTEHHDLTSDNGPLTIIVKEYRGTSGI